MNIRYARETDLPSIVDIYNAAVPGRLATADLEPVSPQSRLDWFRAHSPGKHPIWVVDDRDRVSGWLSLHEFYGRPAYYKTAEVSIYIDPAYQRQGLGKELLRSAIAQCPSLEIHTLLGFIFGHNHASLKLFTSCGFQHWGCMPRIAELDGIERDLIVMGLRLTD
ncbi:GNAT family N-acetyltransferase [Pseudanabaena sp. PCC 6802]|uniref:GNAT family N-acetyltransferase n=1 Tax=Pseudanabaena sp. PCC 6802 TaxID=118173 RepID=UPI0004757FE1